MKHITKQQEPKEFIDWKAKASADWQPTFENLRGSPTGVDDIVKLALLREQGGLCCYCERKITMDDSHIEHFRPLSRFEELSLNYNNLHCSCIKEPKRTTDRHCGHFKGEWFDEKDLISPLDSSCEQRFKYDGNGNIDSVDKNDTAAERTKNQLGLNNGDLPQRRKEIIDVFNGANREPLTEDDIDNFSVDDQRKFAEGYLLIGDDGSFNEFWTTVQYMLNQLPSL